MAQVSVVIPTYNRATYLERAIASVLRQNFCDLEIIVVDDASSDHTFASVAGFSNPKIRYLRHDANKGGSAARNTGIRESSSDYLAFLDDDDEWLPDKLAKQVAIMGASPREVGCVYTGALSIDRSSGRVIGQWMPTKKGDLSEALISGNCVGSTSSALLRAECFEKVGLFDESLASSQDYELWVRIAQQYLFECVPEPLVRYFHHPDKISTNVEALRSALQVMEGKYRDHPLWQYYSSERYLDIGIMHCLAGDAKKGRDALIRSIKSCPLRARSYANLALALCGASAFRKVKEAKRRFRLSRRNAEQQIGGDFQ